MMTFVMGMFLRMNGSIGTKKEVNSRIGDEIDLKFVHVDVEGSFKTERGGERRDNLGNETIEVFVGGFFHPKLVFANVIDGFIIEHKGHIGVFQEGMGG